MRIFVTGATGFVGSAIVDDLIAHGHQVLGLARSEAGLARLAAKGVEVLKGELTDLDGLRRGAAGTDATIHTAFVHDFSKFAENCEIDVSAIEAMGAAIAGTEKPLLVTSGMAVTRKGPLATEEDGPVPNTASYPRKSEVAMAALAARGLRVGVVRLPPSVHGDGDHGFAPMLIGFARQTGVSAYVGEGANRWPATHRLDVAPVYRLALEKGVEPGARYHAIAEQGVPFREIAGVIGRRLGLPVMAKSHAEAKAHFGWMGEFAGMDMPSSGAATQTRLGWTPSQPGLIADMDRPVYFGG